MAVLFDLFVLLLTRHALADELVAQILELQFPFLVQDHIIARGRLDELCGLGGCRGGG